MKSSSLAALIGAALFCSAASAETLYGLSFNNSLVTFDSATPGVTSSTGITGLQPDEALLGIDYRPANQQLYAVGNSNTLYTVDIGTGAATPVVGGVPGFVLTATHYGFDFNPVPDRIRVTGDDDQNIRLNPNNGALAGTDTNINPSADIVGSAYDRNDNNPATNTTLYVLDAATNALYLQGGVNGTPSPNGGTLTLIGALGVDITGFTGFDISGNTGIAYAALEGAGFTSALYTLNLANGAASLVGTIGTSFPLVNTIRGLTAAPIPLPASVFFLGAGLVGIAARLRRRSAK